MHGDIYMSIKDNVGRGSKMDVDYESTFHYEALYMLHDDKERGLSSVCHLQATKQTKLHGLTA